MAEKKRKNLILGQGLIGTELAKLLKEKQEEVVVLSREQGEDLKQAEKYIDQFLNADRVWFVAWDVGIWKKTSSENYETTILASNLELCRSVFGVLESTKKPFLFVSSQAALAPDMVTLGVTKRVGEMWTRLLGGHIARLWNVYGWEKSGEKSHLIPDLVSQALRRKKIEMMTNGKETRQFLYVRDCVEAFFHQMEIGQKEADITSGNWVAVEEVAKIICGKLDAEIIFGEKQGRPSYWSPKINLESWKPRFSLEDGLNEVIVIEEQMRNAAL